MADANTAGNKGKNNAAKYAAGAVIAVIIIGILFLGLRGGTKPITTASTTISVSTTPNSGFGNLSVQLTDPAIVPSGTQSLIVTYSGVDLHEKGAANSTGFADFAANGTINLLNLTNVSQTIAVIRIRANQSFDLIRFDIKSANITINNMTYNVTVATGGVVARINSTINATSNGGVLIDLSPTVLQAYTGANQSVFVLVPSAVAVAIGRSIVNGNMGFHLGMKEALQDKLAATIYAQRPNISITSATASEAGNMTQFHITVKNNGNSSVLLSDVDVKGFFEAIPAYYPGTPILKDVINAEPIMAGNGSLSATAGFGPSNNWLINSSANAGGDFEVGQTTQLNSSLDSTVLADLHSGQNVGASGTLSGFTPFAIEGAEIFNRNFYNQLNFIVESNGTMELPYEVAMVDCPAIIVSGGNATVSMPDCPRGNIGYLLAPGASANLTFSGLIKLSNVGVVVSPDLGVQAGASGPAGWAEVGPRAGGVVVVLIPNQTYYVAVHGRRGAYASTKVNATGYTTNYTSKLVDVTSVSISLHDTSNGSKTYNETLAGFLSHTNSTISYSVYSYGGAYAMVLPKLPSYGINVTGFQVNTAGFVLLNYSMVTHYPPCPVCMPGKPCPMYACAWGTGEVYLLQIKTPQTNYTGTLLITEDYTQIATATNVAANATANSS